MSLGSRLLIVVALLIATYVATALVVVSTQRSQMVDQVDRRLMELPPDALIAADRPARDVVVPASGGPEIVEVTNNPFSELHVGLVDAGGTVTTLVSGPLPSNPPDLREAVTATDGGQRIATIGAVGEPERFRALVLPRPGSDAWIVAAQSLEETDAAIARLVRTLWIAGAVTAVVLGVAFFWVQRLGLRPIARVTAAAEAITAGDRLHRVEVRDQGTEVGKLGRAFNLMLDERDESEARLRQFVADASHELRTPLTSVRGYLELYRQGAFPDTAQMDDVVRRLSAEATRMHGLVEDLLALASLDEGRPLRDDPVDLGQVLRDAAQDARAVQAEREITVVAPESGPIIVGDPALLVQLVGILVSNALAHTPVRTAVTLTVTQGATEAVVSVADQGPGLEAEAATRVFDRFWRGQSSRARSGRTGRGGAGLGLAIARSITDAHGGAILLDTRPGEGCTFSVRLPLERSTR